MQGPERTPRHHTLRIMFHSSDAVM
nr:unnamed protein product [Callosobruchus chinensis]